MSEIILDYSQNFEKIETIAQLRAYPIIGVRHGDAVLVVGGSVVGDGGGGIFVWNEDVTFPDDGTWIKPNDLSSLQSGRWRALIAGGSAGGPPVNFVSERIFQDEDGIIQNEETFLPVGDIYLVGLSVEERETNSVTLYGPPQVAFASVSEGFIDRLPVGDIYLRDLRVETDENGNVVLVDPGQPLWIWDTTTNGGAGAWVASIDQTAIRVKAGAGITVSTEPFNDPNNWGQRTLVISANIPTPPDPAPFYPLVQNITGTATNLNPFSNFYMRFTSASAKTLTVRSEANQFYNDEPTEWRIRNAGAGVLTIVAQAGVTINPPENGLLTINNGGSATLKRISADVFDLIR